MITRRCLLAAPLLVRGATRVSAVQHRGVLINDCTLAGDRRQDDVVPAHPNGIQVSRDKWLNIYATRGFRGVDDDGSIVYQLRVGTPDGKLIREGMFSKAITDWDPFGDGKERFIRQHGHPVAFGVPKGVLIRGKPARHANLFVAKWRVVAKVMDHERNSLVRNLHDHEIGERTQDVEWLQFRLNAAEDNIEVVQPRRGLRQRGYDSNEEFCSLPGSGRMNQSFVQAVPFNADATEWADVNHFMSGKSAALKYRFNPSLRLYEWVETGPSLFDVRAGECSLVKYRDIWLVSGRQSKDAVAWVRTDDPFTGKISRSVSPPAPAAGSPICAYMSPDGVVRVFTGDATVSPHKKDRDPLYMWDIDPHNDFKVTKRTTIFDSVAAALPIRPGAATKVDMCKLLPHVGGRTQFLAHRVSIRAFNFPYVSLAGQLQRGIPIANEQEKAACAIYYATIRYEEDFPSVWQFAHP